MYKSKLIQIISKLSNTELQLLRSFVKDSNFNKHEKVIELLEIIIVHEKNLPELDKKQVFAVLYKNQPYNDLMIRHVMSYLLKVVEKFGVLHKKTSNELEILHDQAMFYNAIEYEKGIEETLHLYGKKMLNQQVLNTEEIYAKYLLDTYAYNQAIKNKRTDVKHLIELNKSLDEFFILSKLKVVCNIINQQNIFNLTIDRGFFKDLMEYVAKNYLGNKMISLYYHIYQLISTDNATEYALSVTSFNECMAIKNKADLKDASVLLINYCIKRINQGDTAFEQEAYNQYRIGIEREILLDKELLSPFTYSNALSIAIKQNDLKWAFSLLEKYKDQLDTEHPQDYYSLNKAKYLVADKRFEEALEFINKSEINDLLTQLQFRIIQLKIFIELDEFRLAESFIANFKQLLKRKGIINYHKNNFNNIAKYMLKLIKVAPYSKTGKLKLIKDIGNEKVLSEKNWLLEKLA